MITLQPGEVKQVNVTLTAILSDDICQGGVATADSGRDSGSIFSADPQAAFDDNEATGWLSALAAPPHWLKYDLGVSKVANILRFLAYAGNNYRVFEFTLEGSNDDANWTLLLNANHNGSGEWGTYTFTNSTPYRYYRFTVLTSKVDLPSNYDPPPPWGTGIFEVELRKQG